MVGRWVATERLGARGSEEGGVVESLKNLANCGPGPRQTGQGVHSMYPCIFAVETAAHLGGCLMLHMTG